MKAVNDKRAEVALEIARLEALWDLPPRRLHPAEDARDQYEGEVLEGGWPAHFMVSNGYRRED